MLICSVANFGDGNMSAIANFRRSMAWQHTVPGCITASTSQYNRPLWHWAKGLIIPEGVCSLHSAFLLVKSLKMPPSFLDEASTHRDGRIPSRNLWHLQSYPQLLSHSIYLSMKRLTFLPQSPRLQYFPELRNEDQKDS